MLSKIGDRAVLGLPKEPQPQKQINERGWGFLKFGWVLRPFFGSHFWPLFIVLRLILGVIFVTLFRSFRSWASLGRSSVFEGPPMRNASFLGGQASQKTSKKGVPKGVQKWTPKKTRTSHFWGLLFGTFFGLLGLPWGTLLLSCRLLAPGAQKGRPKSSLREAKSLPRAARERPREAQGRPRGSQKCPRRARERPKRAPDRPRGAQDRPKRDQERPRQAKRAPKRDQVSPRKLKRAPKRDQERKKSDNRYPKETQRDQVGRHERPKERHRREIKRRVPKEAQTQERQETQAKS